MKKLEEENIIKQQELEKIKLEEIEIRSEKIKLLLFNLNRMSSFDSKIKNLKESLQESIVKYNDLTTEYIILNNDIYNDTRKFINSIRINSQDKELITELFRSL